jgi:adenosylhomocysteine nucleosidase
MTLGIVCGYAAEHRIAKRITSLAVIGWKRPDAARYLIEQGATKLLSFGLAGGLDPALKTGDLIIPSKLVMTNGSTRETSADFRHVVDGMFPKARTGAMYASHHVVSTVADKYDLFSRTQAQAIDMESADLARVAEAAGIPYAVLRVIADEAEDTLPPAALAALNDLGDVALSRVVGSLVRHPLQLPALMRTGRQSKIALAALQETVELLRQVA